METNFESGYTTVLQSECLIKLHLPIQSADAYTMSDGSIVTRNRRSAREDFIVWCYQHDIMPRWSALQLIKIIMKCSTIEAQRYVIDEDDVDCLVQRLFDYIFELYGSGLLKFEKWEA